MGSPPYNLRTLAGLPEGQTPVFAMCPAHAGTGATMGVAMTELSDAVRPTRAQGQPPRQRRSWGSKSPAHAGTPPAGQTALTGQDFEHGSTPRRRGRRRRGWGR